MKLKFLRWVAVAAILLLSKVVAEAQNFNGGPFLPAQVRVVSTVPANGDGNFKEQRRSG